MAAEPEPSAIYFAETGHTVRGPLLRAWLDQGQARLIGLPVAAEQYLGSALVQYFERGRLDLTIDDYGAPIGVATLAKLGAEALGEQHPGARAPTPPIDPHPERRYFRETRHTLSFAFKRFWERNGGQAQFGLPITEEVTVQGQRTIQYFERARFEYVPGRAGGDDVDLGHIGSDVARQRGVPRKVELPSASAMVWSPALARDLEARRQMVTRAQALAAVTPIAAQEMQVAVPVAATAWSPTTSAADAGPIYQRHIYQVDGWVDGDAIDGATRWWRLALDGSFVPAAHLRPYVAPPPPRSWTGRWVDVNLSSFMLTVYDGATPLRSALIIAGRKDRTPTGVFPIFKRVESEIMDSSTVGFPPGHPEHYLIKNVAHAQYFTGAGHAIHGNYWVHPSRFGQFLSNGCIGLRNHDAAWVWSLTQAGTIIHIHY
jgi:hypothetical protein